MEGGSQAAGWFVECRLCCECETGSTASIARPSRVASSAMREENEGGSQATSVLVGRVVNLMLLFRLRLYATRASEAARPKLRFALASQRLRRMALLLSMRLLARHRAAWRWLLVVSTAVQLSAVCMFVVLLPQARVYATRAS